VVSEARIFAVLNDTSTDNVTKWKEFFNEFITMVAATTEVSETTYNNIFSRPCPEGDIIFSIPPCVTVFPQVHRGT